VATVSPTSIDAVVVLVLPALSDIAKVEVELAAIDQGRFPVDAQSRRSVHFSRISQQN
jgi:hypothetical protein